MWTKIFAWLFGVIAVVGTVLPLLKHDVWWIRVFDFPRIHLLLFGAAAIVLLLVPFSQIYGPWRIGALVLILACFVYQATAMFPYSPLMPKQVHPVDDASDARLSLLVSNVLMTNREEGRLLRLVQEFDPDMVLTLETDAWWSEALRSLDPRYPYGVRQPQDNTYGMILHSRLPLDELEVRFLVEDEIPSIKASVRLSNGTPVRLYFLHPKPPYPREAEQTTERDAELLMVGRAVEETDEVAVVAGDLNDVAWSHTTRLFQRISGMLDPRIGRGMYNTFHAGNPILRWPLDHVFHTKHFKLARLERLPNIGSDHFPIFVELALDGTAPLLHKEPEPDAEDETEAAEKISRAREED